jgi:hypothetical protein
MTRLHRALAISFVTVVLVGVVVLIVVEVAGYDGPMTAEIKSEKPSGYAASLTHCPKEPLGRIEGQHDPGTRGKTVPPRPESALLCSWTYERVRGHGEQLVRHERLLRRPADLAELTDALNALPPAVPWGEGEYACPEEGFFYTLIGLRYEGEPEAQLAVAPGFCSGTAVLNLKEDKEFGASSQLLRLLDDLVEPSA